MLYVFLKQVVFDIAFRLHEIITEAAIAMWKELYIHYLVQSSQQTYTQWDSARFIQAETKFWGVKKLASITSQLNDRARIVIVFSYSNTSASSTIFYCLSRSYVRVNERTSREKQDYSKISPTQLQLHPQGRKKKKQLLENAMKLCKHLIQCITPPFMILHETRDA